MQYEEFLFFLFERDECQRDALKKGVVYPEVNFSEKEVVEYSRRFFSDVVFCSEKYTEDQLCCGVEYLVGNMLGGWCYFFFDESVDEEYRIDALRSMYGFFDSYFNIRCADVIAHNSVNELSAVNRLCYMWWDILPRHGIPSKSSLVASDNAILVIMDKILKLNSIACKESALHGLGHWQSAYPERVEEIIKGNRLIIPESLTAYSESALSGHVQ